MNLVIGREFNKYGVRLAAGYIDTVIGFQGNFLLNLSRSKSFNHHVSLGVGTTAIESTVNYYGRIENHTWTYLGGFYDLNYYGFFLETGLTIGTGSYTNPQFALQLGYVYEFR